MHRLRPRLTYANVVSTIALFAAMGGGTYAAASALLPRNSVGSAQLKRGAVTHTKIGRNAVDGSSVKDHSLTGADINLARLGKVPLASSADHAGSADSASHAGGADVAGHAGSADTATHAGSADSATHAGSADSAADSAKLGGVAASGYQQTTAKSGQTLAGAFSVRYPPNAAFVVGFGSYPVPLPAGTPDPTYHYVDGSSDGTCPGIGQAPAGVLCLYGYNASNLHFTNESGGADLDPQRRYGWSFDANADTAAAGGFIIGSWAYRVP